MCALSSRTPLKAERFERDDDFFFLFSKKRKRETTPQSKYMAIIKNILYYFIVFYEPITLTTKHSTQTAEVTPYLTPQKY